MPKVPWSKNDFYKMMIYILMFFLLLPSCVTVVDFIAISVSKEAYTKLFCLCGATSVLFVAHKWQTYMFCHLLSYLLHFEILCSLFIHSYQVILINDCPNGLNDTECSQVTFQVNLIFDLAFTLLQYNFYFFFNAFLFTQI